MQQMLSNEYGGMNEVMAEMSVGAENLGADAILSIDIDYESVGTGGMLMVAASGTAVNLAARLCDEAADGEILLSPRAYAAVEDDFTAESKGEISLKGISAPVEIFRVTAPGAPG
jgi:hypothetical protein